MEKILELDGKILLWIQNNLRSDVMNTIEKFITNFGGFIAAAMVLMIIIPKTRRLGIMTFAANFMADMLANGVLKKLVERVRPYEVVEGLTSVIGAMSSTSFPSGHSACSFAIATVIFLETKKKVGIPALILAAMIASSRLYLGVHYPTDVLAGITVGVLNGCFTSFVYHRFIEKKIGKKKEVPAA